jgi:hypothetical protein
LLATVPEARGFWAYFLDVARQAGRGASRSAASARSRRDPGVRYAIRLSRQAPLWHSASTPWSSRHIVSSAGVDVVLTSARRAGTRSSSVGLRRLRGRRPLRIGTTGGQLSPPLPGHAADTPPRRWGRRQAEGDETGGLAQRLSDARHASVQGRVPCLIAQRARHRESQYLIIQLSIPRPAQCLYVFDESAILRSSELLIW